MDYMGDNTLRKHKKHTICKRFFVVIELTFELYISG